MKILDTVPKSQFILSNLSKTALVSRGENLTDIVPVYGGIGHKLEIEIKIKSQTQFPGAIKEIPIEPVGVFVIGIDGLRQDVLYPDIQDGQPFENVDEVIGTSPYYVNPTSLPGLGQILVGNPEDTMNQQYVMLKEVTTVFPSITLAAWASIFTGKQPGEHGILGNEFFARDLDVQVPERFTPPKGMITFGSGAFKGYDRYPNRSKLLDSSFFVPYQFDWRFPPDPEDYPQNQQDVLTAPTVFEQINQISGLVSRFNEAGGDPSVVAHNMYARGAYWLTWDLENLIQGESQFLDDASHDKLDDYLAGKYRKGILFKKRNDVPFSALTVWYLPGLDHESHIAGMGGYADYFRTTTDDYIRRVVERLKELGEFDNKIFIVTSDHGVTEMPAPNQMILEEKDEFGNVIKKWDGDASCELELKGFGSKKVQFPELANNNLHIWELANLFSQFPSSEVAFSILAHPEIAKVTETAAATLDQANIIAALNGPMAHIYIRGSKWTNQPNPKLLDLVAVRLHQVLKEGSQTTGSLRKIINDHFPRLKSSVEAILIRNTLNSSYEVVESLSEDAQGKLVINPVSLQQYYSGRPGVVDVVNRIERMNHPNRSGDIILLMNDPSVIPQGSTINEQRFTTGVSCRAWHGSLNRSDSYVPLVVAYPGGNKEVLGPLVGQVCVDNQCEGNWKVTELIKKIIETQYSGQ